MDHASESVTLLVGAGSRLVELRVVLGALASLPASPQGSDPSPVDDLAELMEPRLGAGRLLLECDQVPVEDIGFVRRFLERHPEWQLVLVGTARESKKSQRLLSFAGARWLAWPPDLDQIKALLSAGRETSTPAEGSSAPEDSLADELVPRTAPPPAAAAPEPAQPPSADECDLGASLEELLAGRSVGGEDTPRYLYRAEAELTLPVPAKLLFDVFEGLLALAEACAGPGQVIGVRAQAHDDGALVAIDFPPGPLTDGDLPELLAGKFSGDPEVEHGVAMARAAGETLQELGGAVRVTTGRPGRLCLEANLPVVETAER